MMRRLAVSLVAGLIAAVLAFAAVSCHGTAPDATQLPSRAPHLSTP